MFGDTRRERAEACAGVPSVSDSVAGTVPPASDGLGMIRPNRPWVSPGAGGEVQVVALAVVGGARAELDRPRPPIESGWPLSPLQRAARGPRAVVVLVERVDAAVAEVADQQVAAEGAEVRVGLGAMPHGALSAPAEATRARKLPSKSTR